MWLIHLVGYIFIAWLTFMTITIVTNIAIRPSLWTSFNMLMIIYFVFSILLGSFKIFMIADIITNYLEPVDEAQDLDSLVAEQFFRADKLEDNCTILVFWSGTAILRETILTGMIFIR